MRIELLREFVVLIKHQNYSSAAKELFCSQPGLSNHMASLEKDLGFKLINRQGNHLNLTPAGAEFLKQAQSIVETYDKALDTCKTLAKATPPVRIASVAVNSPLYRLLQTVVDTPFTFVDIGFDVPLFKAFEKGLIDVGFHQDFTGVPSLVEEAQRQHLAWLPVGKSPIAICYSRSNPLAEKEVLRREDLRGSTVRIHSGQHFDSWKKVVLSVLGDDLDLRFRLDPVESYASISFLDYADSVHICGRESMEDLLSGRDDIVLCSRLADVDLDLDLLLVYREDDKLGNVAALVDEVRQHQAEPSVC